MKEYRNVGGIVYHKCGKGNRLADGICDFETSNDGITTINCRVCGSIRSISEFITEIAQYHTAPAY